MTDDALLKGRGEFEPYGEYDITLEGIEENQISKDARTLYELTMAVMEGNLLLCATILV